MTIDNLFFVLLCLIYSQLLDARGGLPDAIAWNTKLMMAHENMTRIWNIHDLEPAFENRGGQGLTQMLLDKLGRGGRIVVLGIGSSFIATSGGCFQVDMNI